MSSLHKARMSSPKKEMMLLMMVLMMALHSQLEYPLWYLYFLLPTAWAWGVCLGAGEPATAAPATAARRSSPWSRAAPRRGRPPQAGPASISWATIATSWRRRSGSCRTTRASLQWVLRPTMP